MRSGDVRGGRQWCGEVETTIFEQLKNVEKKKKTTDSKHSKQIYILAFEVYSHA